MRFKSLSSTQSTYFSPWKRGGQSKVRLKAKRLSKEEERSSRDIPMPQGVWWLKHANVKQEAAFGDSFVIHRRSEGSDLVLAGQGDTTVQVWLPALDNLVFRSGVPLLPPEFDSDVIEVEFTPVEDVRTAAIVLAGTGPVCEPLEEPCSPRRTQKVKFTCNRCQTRSEKFINPHAWRHGVVFCRCEGCKVVHLIRDEKGVFSSLKGPLFPQRFDLRDIKIPEGLPQNPWMPDSGKEQGDSGVF